MRNIILGPDGYPIAGDACLACGHCQAVCPKDAITLNQVAAQSLPLAQKEKIDLELMKSLIKSRRSIREFKDEPLDKKLFDNLLDTLRWSPTGGNSQLVNWLVVESAEKRKEISRLVIEWMKGNDNFRPLVIAWKKGYDPILRGAPVLAIAHAGNEYGSTAADCIIAVHTLDLLANSQKLGTCWAGFVMLALAANFQPLREYLELPANHQGYAALMLGYPAVNYKRVPERNPLKVRRM